MPKPLELTVHEAIGEIARLSYASLNGGVTVHSSAFRNVSVSGTHVRLSGSGLFVAERFGNVKISVLSEKQRGITYQEAKSLDDQLRVPRIAGNGFVSYSLKGNVDNKFNRGWFGFGRQLYHYSYEVKASFVVEASPVYNPA